MNGTDTLLFVSPRFLFPVDSGGKIRTTQILRGLKGGGFRIRLLSPGSAALARKYAAELAGICDEFAYWPEKATGVRRQLARALYLLHRLPMPVRSDLSGSALSLVARSLADRPAVAVFDFLHGAVLAPEVLACPAVLFTHNIEAEIFKRHSLVARNPFLRALWSQQYRKMVAFEYASLRRFEVVVAVSERDAQAFRADYRLENTFVIPTGVDLDYFSYRQPERATEIVFCGSMDWLANQDGVRYFMDEVWSLVADKVPGARLTVIGRAPPASLVDAARARGLPWIFTGFVDDVRPYVAGAAVSVVPLRVGGGTRLKVFESMAMGPVVVSTTIGAEGLPVVSGQHCVIADSAAAFAAATVMVLTDRARRVEMSRAARAYVEDNCGHRVAAREFERGCRLAIARFSGRAVGSRQIGAAGVP